MGIGENSRRRAAGVQTVKSVVFAMLDRGELPTVAAVARIRKAPPSTNSAICVYRHEWEDLQKYITSNKVVDMNCGACGHLVKVRKQEKSSRLQQGPFDPVSAIAKATSEVVYLCTRFPTHERVKRQRGEIIQWVTTRVSPYVLGSSPRKCKACVKDERKILRVDKSKGGEK